MNLNQFDIGGFIPLVLLEVVLMGWIGWVVVSLHEMGVNVCLDPPGSFPLGWLLLSLVWAQEDIH